MNDAERKKLVKEAEYFITHYDMKDLERLEIQVELYAANKGISLGLYDSGLIAAEALTNTVTKKKGLFGLF